MRVKRYQRVSAFDILDPQFIRVESLKMMWIIGYMKVRWRKWRSALGKLCDLRVFTKLKEKFYKTVIIQTMICGTKCYDLKKKHVHKIIVA